MIIIMSGAKVPIWTLKVLLIPFTKNCEQNVRAGTVGISADSWFH